MQNFVNRHLGLHSKLEWLTVSIRSERTDSPLAVAQLKNPADWRRRLPLFMVFAILRNAQPSGTAEESKASGGTELAQGSRTASGQNNPKSVVGLP